LSSLQKQSESDANGGQKWRADFFTMLGKCSGLSVARVLSAEEQYTATKAVEFTQQIQDLFRCVKLLIPK